MPKEKGAKIQVIAIVGPTGSGKSAVAEQIAAKFSAVIVNADARQIYRNLPILTAVPAETRGMLLYEFLEVAEPFSFAQYVELAAQAINVIHSQNKVSLIVGGTGLYVDSLLKSAISPPEIDLAIRKKVAAMSVKVAGDELLKLDPAIVMKIDMRNPRRVARALEVVLQTGKSITEFWEAGAPRYDYLKIGWTQPPEILKQRITKRVQQMWESGAVDEVQKLLASGHTLTEPGMQAIGVAEIADFLAGKISAVAAQEKMIARTWQYARRQMTWWRRDPKILWYTSLDELWPLIQNFLPPASKTRWAKP